MGYGLILCAAFAICGAATAEPDSAPANAPPASTPQAASPAATEPMTVTIVGLGDDTVCRRQAPTGSRIMTKRCYSRAQREAAAASANERSQQEQLDELRRLQLYREQERALARTEALRRAAER